MVNPSPMTSRIEYATVSPKSAFNVEYKIKGTPKAPKLTTICMALLVWRLDTFSFRATVCLLEETEIDKTGGVKEPGKNTQ